MSYNPDTMPNAVFQDLTVILDQIKVWSVNRHADINTSISGLSTQISALQTLTASNDLNLDTVDEIVDFIKTTRASLDTILINDLTTGGTAKALTAEQGKILKGLIDDANAAASALTVRVVALETKVSTLEAEQALMQQESANLQAKFNEFATGNAVRFPQA
tara:strand:- start:8679 stop:9164 length:486 start_codon:yes stop_codon:yes gene_type:complete